MKKSIYILLLFSLQLFGQEYNLQQCFELAIRNHPLKAQANSIKEIHDLHAKNYQANWFPQVTFNGQATYQDPVLNIELPVELPIPVPLEFPSPSPDQYKTWIEIKQNIYDGGIMASLKKIERQSDLSETIEHEILVEKIKYVITEVYFNILILDQHIKQTEIIKSELEEKLLLTKSLVERGVVLPSNYDGLKGEILKIEQKITTLRKQKETALAVLSSYTKLENHDTLELKYPEFSISINDSVKRKEYLLFDAKVKQLDMTKNLLKKENYPKLFGFSQVGYGKPGLNMLNDSFEPYYIIGAGVSMNLTNWNRTKRNVQEKEIMISNIKMQRNQFELEQEIMINKTLAEIDTYKKMMGTDEEIIQMFRSVALVAGSQFDNGTINTSQYITEINKEKQAQLSYEIHKLRYTQSIVNLKLIKGEI